MVFLTSIDILDTGFLSLSNRSSQLSKSNRVNNGDALRLRGVNINYTTTANLDAKPIPSMIPSSLRDYNEVSLISLNNPTIQIIIFFNKGNTSTDNIWGINDKEIIYKIPRLVSTLGVKAVYYPVDISASDSGSSSSRNRDFQIPNIYGITDTTENQGDIDINLWTGTTFASGKNLKNIKYLPVRFKSISNPETTYNGVRITITGVITP